MGKMEGPGQLRQNAELLPEKQQSKKEQVYLKW
jgi:hypothetical protein